MNSACDSWRRCLTSTSICGIPVRSRPPYPSGSPVLLGVILVQIIGAIPGSIDARGAEFQVNTHSTDDQAMPRVAMDDLGNFVVVWDSWNQDGDLRGIYGQRFNISGQKLGDEFRVNTTTAGQQNTPGISMTAGGDFVVAWSSPDGSEEGIFARRYDSNGVALTAEFQVNTYTESRQIRPDIAMHDSGAFVVVWESDLEPDPDAHTAQWHAIGRAYGAGGAAHGEEFIVNQELHGRDPSVAMDENADFVVAFQRDGGFSYYVETRDYFANGTPKGNVEQITGDLGASASPQIAMNAAGEYVVAWHSNPGDFVHNDIHVQSFAPDGTPVGVEFLANTTLPGQQSSHSVALGDHGELLVAWADFERSAVFTQAYDGDRMPIGGEFPLNTYVNQQDFAFINTDVAMNNSGRYVAVWQSEGQDGEDGGIFARIGVIPEPTVLSLTLTGAMSLLLIGRCRNHSVRSGSGNT